MYLKKQWICGRFSGLFIATMGYTYVLYMISTNLFKVSNVPLEALGCSQPNGVLPEKISYFVDEDAFLFKKNPRRSSLIGKSVRDFLEQRNLYGFLMDFS